MCLFLVSGGGFSLNLFGEGVNNTLHERRPAATASHMCRGKRTRYPWFQPSTIKDSRVAPLRSYNHKGLGFVFGWILNLLGVSKESRNILYRDYTGIIFLCSLQTSSKTSHAKTPSFQLGESY